MPIRSRSTWYRHLPEAANDAEKTAIRAADARLSDNFQGNIPASAQHAGPEKRPRSESDSAEGASQKCRQEFCAKLKMKVKEPCMTSFCPRTCEVDLVSSQSREGCD